MTQDVFLSFLEPIADHFSDPQVNEIRINPNGSIYEERNGEIVHLDGVTIAPVLIEFAVGTLAGEADQPVNHKYPQLDVRLDDGSRVAVLAPPVVSPGYALTIRRFPRAFTLAEFVAMETMTDWQAEFLRSLVLARKTIVISGATRAGKTTLARVLLNQIPHPGDRLVLIEKPSELNLTEAERRDILTMEVRKSTPNAPGFSATDCIEAALRHSPDRIILGELRGDEASDFLEALNTGHSGSLTTIHANSAVDALERLVTLTRRAGITYPREVLVDTVSRAIDFVVHLDRSQGRRKLTEIVEVLAPENGLFLTKAITQNQE